MTVISGERSSSSIMAEMLPSSPCPDESRQEIIKRLEELEPQLDALEEIPEVFHDIPLTCMRESTDMELCYRLDPTTDIHADSNYTKDYRGMAEWIKLDQVFIKYLTRTESRFKTTDVLAKWSTIEKESPLPNLGNLQRCLCGEGGIDRPDVITDLAPKINRDAFNWKMEKYRANTTKPVEKDTSWQLTRQDMIVGSRTYYTCCLIYADEDEGMACMITNLFKAVDRQAVFFNPQFDLKMGKYLHDSTAQVIDERCGGKVIFIISEYFFASPVCQFTVNFAKGLDMAAEQGNLIPFRLTERTDHVPRVLLGIAGIRWYRKNTRKNAWCQLVVAILGQNLDEKQLEDLKQRVTSVVEMNPEIYLADPPYDADTPAPGSPIPVYDPAPDGMNSDDPSSRQQLLQDSDCLVQESHLKPRSRLKRVRHYVRKKILNRFFHSNDPSRRNQELYKEEMDDLYDRFQNSSVNKPTEPRGNTEDQVSMEARSEEGHEQNENEHEMAQVQAMGSGENGSFEKDTDTEEGQ